MTQARRKTGIDSGPPTKPASNVVPIGSARTTSVQHFARVRVRRVGGTKHGDTVQVEDVLTAGAPYTLSCTHEQMNQLLPLQWQREFDMEAEVRVSADGRIVRGRLVSLLAVDQHDNGEGAAAWFTAAAGDHWSKVSDIDAALGRHD